MERNREHFFSLRPFRFEFFDFLFYLSSDAFPVSFNGKRPLKFFFVKSVTKR